MEIIDKMDDLSPDKALKRIRQSGVYKIIRDIVESKNIIWEDEKQRLKLVRFMVNKECRNYRLGRSIMSPKMNETAIGWLEKTEKITTKGDY